MPSLTLNKVVVLASLQTIPGISRILSLCNLRLTHPGFHKACAYAFSKRRRVDLIASFEHLSLSIDALNNITGESVVISNHVNKSPRVQTLEIKVFPLVLHRITFWRDYFVHGLVSKKVDKLWRSGSYR